MTRGGVLVVVGALTGLMACGHGGGAGEVPSPDPSTGLVQYRLIEASEPSAAVGSSISYRPPGVGRAPIGETLRGEFQLRAIEPSEGGTLAFAITSLQFESASYAVRGETGRIEVQSSDTPLPLTVGASVAINSEQVELVGAASRERFALNGELSFRGVTLHSEGGFALNIFAEPAHR